MSFRTRIFLVMLLVSVVLAFALLFFSAAALKPASGVMCRPVKSARRIDKDRLTVLFAGKECELTLVEWRILATLNSKVSRIFSRDQLINHAYDDQRVVNDRTIDSHINKLRKKLVGLIGEDPIKSVYGVGYKLELPG